MQVAFKEWAAVCRALSRGRQALILRKGGIAEARGAFRPEHSQFWLYPTHFHELQAKGLKPAFATLIEATDADFPAPGMLGLSHYVEVAQTWFVDKLETALALEPLHVWSAELVRQRFRYRTPGLFVLAVRTFFLPDPIDVPELPEYAGCKTWVTLERDVPTEGGLSVLTDDEFQRALGNMRKVLDRRA